MYLNRETMRALINEIKLYSEDCAKNHRREVDSSTCYRAVITRHLQRRPAPASKISKI